MNSVEVILAYEDGLTMPVVAPELPHGTMNKVYAAKAAERAFVEGTHHRGKVVGARCVSPSGETFYEIGDVA